MNKLKIKNWLCLLSFIVGIALFAGCGEVKDVLRSGAEYRFIEPVQIVEVNTDTKSFRIVLEYVTGEQTGSPIVHIDTKKTTARHNVHFINHIGPSNTIGDFTPMDDNKMFYRDVVLLPDDITSEVSIFYMLVNAGVDRNLEVILKPKTD